MDQFLYISVNIEKLISPAQQLLDSKSIVVCMHMVYLNVSHLKGKLARKKGHKKYELLSAFLIIRHDQSFSRRTALQER